MNEQEARAAIVELKSNHPKIFSMLAFQARKRTKDDFIKAYASKRKAVEKGLRRPVSKQEIRTILGCGYDMLHAGEL